MAAWICISQRVVLDVAVAIQRLRIARSPRAARLLLLLATELEPEAKLVFLVELSQEAALVEVDREGLDGDAVHAPGGIAGHDGVGRDEAADGRVIIPGSIERWASVGKVPGQGSRQSAIEEGVRTPNTASVSYRAVLDGGSSSKNKRAFPCN